MILASILPGLLALPRECEWVEFKRNNDDPTAIGEYISALANSAVLAGKECAWLIWGVEDGTHRVVGTTARPRERKVGNEELENWLAHNLAPRTGFEFHDAVIDGQYLVGLRIESAAGSPVSFLGNEWIRVGSIKKKLKDHPAKERDLWRALERRPFETGSAATDLDGESVLGSLDYPAYFELLRAPLPQSRATILDRLAEDRVVVARGPDRFDVTNLGALALARNLDRFPTLKRKAVRVIRYSGVDRQEGDREQVGRKGYGAGFEGLLEFVMGWTPMNEVLKDALRREVAMYPKRALRELLANALVHQDFAISGTGPMVEIFTDRIEVSNPGVPLIEPNRFIDHSPRSRNEVLADLMRRLHICEERGSGFDKVVAAVELFQLPPPDIRVDSTHTRVIVFAHQNLSRMGKSDRIRACYQHSCLRYVSNEVMTNTSLRQRLALPDEDKAVASRIIGEAMAAGMVKPRDPESQSRKYASYVPFWA